MQHACYSPVRGGADKVSKAEQRATESLTLSLSAAERAAVEALCAALASLRERPVEASDAVVAAVEFGLLHLLERFELPSGEARRRAQAALDGVRGDWIRGNCCLEP